MSAAPSVTVVGGGLAGITAALQLGQRGYRVKLYEQTSALGGNLATRTLTSTGGAYDVYPHMYLGWYRNFWRMMEEVGVKRNANFAPLTTVQQVDRDRKWTKLINGYRLTQIVENLTSGWAPTEDMLVFGYAAIDLLAEQIAPTMRLHHVGLSGYLNSRPYMTQGAEEAFETYLTRIWAIPAALVAAKAFRRYLSFCFAEPEPVFWLTRGPAATAVIAPLEAALKRAGVTVQCGVEVTSVTRAGERAGAISMRRTKFNPRLYRWEATGERWTEAVDELILAVPATTLARLVRRERRGRRIVEREESLAELTRLRTERVPILYTCFKRKLEEVPAEPVGLQGSRLNIAFTDISHTWEGVPEFRGRTVCAVSCSDTGGLGGATPTENGYEILAELAEYLKFDPGAAWGKSPDLEWSSTRYWENYDTQLSLNMVGTGVSRPQASCPSISNLYFAGDFSRVHIGLTTIESAVSSGLNAASALVQRRGFGKAVEVLTPPTGQVERYVALRYLLAPLVAGAKAWSLGTEQLRGGPPENGRSLCGDDQDSLLRYLLTPGLPARH